MKTNFKKFGWCALLALLPFAGRGQDTLRVGLQQAIEIALSDNATIQIADKEIERVDYSKKEAWYGLIPTLNGTGEYLRNVKLPTMAIGGQSIQVGQDNTINLGLSLSLPLVVPALWRSIQMTDLEMQMANEKARASKITLRNEVEKAYYQILLAQDSYITLKESFDIAKQNYEEAKERFDLGLAAEYDYVSAEVQMHNMVPTILQVENGITQAKQYLKVLMGVNITMPIAVTGNLMDFENGVVNFADSKSISLDQNTDLMQLDIQQKQLQKQLQLQRTQRMPTLVAFGNFQYQGMGMDDDQTGVDFSTGQPIITPGGMNWYDPSLAVGLRLNVPIFNGFTNSMKEKKIKVSAKTLEIQREYMKDNLGLQVATALDNMDKAVKQMDSNKKGVQLAEKGYQIAQKRYETGGGTMLELRNSTLALTQAKLAYSQAIADYLTAKADYEKVIGQY